MAGENKGEPTSKIVSLESVRGLAAFAVVLFHFIGYYPPSAYSGVMSVLVGAFASETPLFAFINGVYSVTVFFVLSGFVLSYSFFNRGADLVSATLKRYFRLMPVALVSIIFAFILLKLGLLQNSHLIVPSLAWQNPDVNLLQAIWEGIAGIFIFAVGPEQAVTMLNPVLWTIYYELIGSVIIYSMLALCGKDARRLWVYLLSVVIFLNTNFIGFIVGMILADVYCNRPDIVKKVASLSLVYKLIAVIIAIYFASFPPFSSPDALRTLYKPLLFLSNDYVLNRSILYLVASVIVISLALTSRKLRQSLELKPIAYLGSLSYSLYAVHYIILGSVASTLFVWLNGKLSNNKTIAITFVAYIVSSFMTAYIMRRYVDEPSIRWSRRIGYYFSKRPPMHQGGVKRAPKRAS